MTLRTAGRIARFENFTAEPDRTVGLSANHPAVVEGRTLFPGSVASTFQSRRFLVPAENSAKIGKVIEKGPWAGFPVFTLTLEERKTCPRSCHIYEGCFGNAMPWARRHDVFDDDFIPALKAEVITLVREQCAPLRNKPNLVVPKGIVIRLHVLGDFYSVAYVRAWRDLMRAMPEIHVFGYTARAMFPADGDMSIATEIRMLNEEFPDRWVIRWSSDAPGAGRTIVVDEDPQLPDVIVCPAQTKASEACSTCALCWSRPAWGKTIAFLRHGIKLSTRPRKSRDRGGPRLGKNAVRNRYGLMPATERLHEAMLRVADEKGVLRGWTSRELVKEAGISIGQWHKNTEQMTSARLLRVLQPRHGRRGVTWQVFAEPQTEWPPAPLLPAPAKAASAPVHAARDPLVKLDAKPLVARKPEDPLVPHRPQMPKAKYHPRTGTLMNPSVIGSADQFAIGTPEDRKAALDQEERDRIMREYGAKF